MRPIPKSLLIHSVTRRKEQKDRWGKAESYKDEQIQKVKIEPSSRIIRDKNGAEIQLSAEMFYDCKNSIPKGISFETDDIILFNGQKFKIKTVVPLYDKRLHHYELGLIRDA